MRHRYNPDKGLLGTLRRVRAETEDLKNEVLRLRELLHARKMVYEILLWFVEVNDAYQRIDGWLEDIFQVNNCSSENRKAAMGELMATWVAAKKAAGVNYE